MPRYYTCSGQTAYPSFRRAAEALQSDYARHGGSIVCAGGDGCWEAIWLAEQYDVRLLLLCLDAPPAASVFRAHALRNLFAVVCPVLICAPEGTVLPDMPNATMYHVREAADPASLIADFANEL